MERVGEEKTNGKRKPRGRLDHEKQEAVIKHKVIAERAEELVRLKTAADDAAQDYAEAIKKAAEDSGLLASVVRSFINARAGEDFEGAKRKVEQLALVFEEVGG